MQRRRVSVQPLLENCVKHAMREVEPLSIFVLSRTTARGLEIVVADDGIGMSEKVQQHLFDPPEAPRPDEPETVTCIKEGNRVHIEHRLGESASRAATVFQRLVSAGKRLLRVIEHNEGGANKDLAKFADQINALCDKWDR